jgi:ABC-type multidrug transport system fused ATPase/permease subunit
MLMDDEREITESGEALLASLGERALTPPAALRERVLQRAARGERGTAALWRVPRAAWLASIVATAIVVASIAWGIAAQQALAQERSLLAQLQDAAAKDEVVFDIVDARNVNKTTLRSANDDSPTAPYGKVFTRPDMPYVVAMAGRLPPAPNGQEYHLYLDDQRIGTIAPNDGGFGYFVFRAASVGIAYQRATLLLESPQAASATGTVILVSSSR